MSSLLKILDVILRHSRKNIVYLRALDCITVQKNISNLFSTHGFYYSYFMYMHVVIQVSITNGSVIEYLNAI